MIVELKLSEITSAGEYAKHLQMLDDDSQVFRFGGKQSESSISTFADNVFTPQDNITHIVFGVYVNTKDRLSYKLIGHLHVCYEQYEFRTGKAEVSLGILKNYQGRGIGKFILSNAVDLFKEKNIEEFGMDCLKRNDKIVRLIKSIGCTVDFDSYGTEMHAKVIINK